MKNKIPFINTSIIQDLSLTVILIPVWWFLGVRFFIFHLIVMMLFLKYVILQKKKIIPNIRSAESIALLGFIGIYLLSLLMNIKTIPTARIFASLNNLSFWVMGFILIVLIQSSLTRKDFTFLSGSFAYLGIFSGIIVFLGYLYWIFTKSYLSFLSPLFRIIPQTLKEIILKHAPLVKTSLLPAIVGRDKLFQKEFPRTPGFNVYGTALGLTMIILIGMTYIYYRRRNKDKKILIVLVVEFLALILSLSRIAVLAFLISWALVYFFSLIGKKWNKKIIICVLLILVVFLCLIPWNKMVGTINKFRGESTSSRLMLYKLTLSHALEKPLLGHGNKPRTEEAPVPIGSHSTFIGVIYRTGFAGFAVFCIFWGIVLFKWWRMRDRLEYKQSLRPLWYSLGMVLFSGLIWMLTEDLDAPPVAAFLFFIVAGLVLSLDKLKISPEK